MSGTDFEGAANPSETNGSTHRAFKRFSRGALTGDVTGSTDGITSDSTFLHVPEGQTELANARRIVSQYGTIIRYCPSWRAWLIWDGTRWRFDDSGEIVRLAKACASGLWNEPRKAGTTPKAVELARFAHRSCSRKGIDNAVALATTEKRVVIQPDELDADPWLLNCPNGTLDLRSGHICPHEAAAYITKLCPTPYDATASSEVWDYFLNTTLPDSEVREFVQRFFGYCLTGDVREQVLPLFVGEGANGKTTLLMAILETLGGDYAIKGDKKLVVVQNRQTHPTELMDMHGKRFVFVTETERGERLAEALEHF